MAVPNNTLEISPIKGSNPEELLQVLLLGYRLAGEMLGVVARILCIDIKVYFTLVSRFIRLQAWM